MGSVLRPTKKVTRGIGSIRQDVNVSVSGSGIVEVKGVQQLDQLEKVVEYEAKRQHGLLLISEKLKKLKLEKISRQEDVFDITELMKNCKSKIIQKFLKDMSIIKVIKIKNFSGMFSYSPYEAIRLGKEIGQLVRFFGIGGVFHSDELPNYGIADSDIPPIIVTDNEINFAKKNIPKSWDESLLVLQKKYELKPQLAEQIFDSEYLELFEKICTDKNSSPNFVASILCSTITNLERRHLDASLLKSEEIIKSFEFLNQGKITKESIEIIFEQIMSGKTQSVDEAIQKTSMISLSEDELEEICKTVINDNSAIIDAQGLRSIGPLMGSVMKSTRGKASGEKVNLLLQKMIKEYLSNNT